MLKLQTNTEAVGALAAAIKGPKLWSKFVGLDSGWGGGLGGGRSSSCGPHWVSWSGSSTDPAKVQWWWLITNRRPALLPGCRGCWLPSLSPGGFL